MNFKYNEKVGLEQNNFLSIKMSFMLTFIFLCVSNNKAISTFSFHVENISADQSNDLKNLIKNKHVKIYHKKNM